MASRVSIALGTLVGPSAAGFAFDVSHSYTLPILASVCGNLVLIFIVTHAVRWTQTIELLIGAIIGGYCGALVGRRARSSWIRAGTLVIASSITALFFARTYFNFH